MAAAVLLAARRRWLHLTALVLAVLTSEAAIGPGKALFDRPRPPGGLVYLQAHWLCDGEPSSARLGPGAPVRAGPARTE